MFSSTIIPTIGRPTLTRAVQSVLEQSFDDAEFEVIVVNDSGRPLGEAQWQSNSRVRVVATNQRERSVARNTGAALARGTYLHFLDDDDWIAPGALSALFALAQTTSAHWLYGRTQLIDRQGSPLIQLDHGIDGNGFLQAMAGEWIPLQSSMILAGAFYVAGGFEPLISGPEDIDLLRRIALNGDLASMDAIVSHLGMGEEDSSTDTSRHAVQSRWAREKILNQPGVYARMRWSAKGPVWKGRWARIYATSALWNLKNGNPLIGLSRAIYCLASLGWSASDWATGDFWRSFCSSYESETFIRGEAQGQTPHDKSVNQQTPFSQSESTS